MAQSVIDSAMAVGGVPPVADLGSLKTMVYSLFGFYVLVPLFQLVKAKLTKDPVVEELKKLGVAMVDYSKRTDETSTNIILSLEGIHEYQLQMIKKVNDSIKYGLSDETLTIKTFSTALQYSMLRMISMYHERIRKNNIKDRPLILGRYHRGGSRVSGELYVALNGHTCVVNGRKLSGFLNNNGADVLFGRIAEELFNNHVKRATDGHQELNEEDIESALERFSSIVLGGVKRWIHNDKLTLNKQWDKMDEKIKFILDSDEIEFL